jgi:hypothetical protein
MRTELELNTEPESPSPDTIKPADVVLDAPKSLVVNAVEVVAEQKGEKSIVPQELGQKVKDFFSPEKNWESAKRISSPVISTGRVLGFMVFKVLLNILKFSKELIAKRGDVGFAESFGLGKDMFDYNQKKEKKH